MTGGEIRWMFDEYQSHEDVQARLAAFFADPGEEEQAMLKAREDYYRKRLAARPKPRKKKPRKEKQPLPTRLLPICLLPECEYTRERRIFAPPNNRLSRDAQHRSWDGYEWAII
jgi:hypothetical protein